MDKDDKPFSYQEAYGVHIRKVQFSTGLWGPKHCPEENRSGNFHYLTKEQRVMIEDRERLNYFVFNGFAAEGKEFHDPKDNSKYTEIWKEVVLMKHVDGRKGCIAIYPSGEWERQSSKDWKPKLEHFKK
jgi:hypothetical protein